MSLPRNQPRCGVCTSKLVKNGKTSAGRTRWRCKHCGASTTKSRTDITRKAEFDAFQHWLAGTQAQGGYTIPRRTFRHRIRWCWNVAPALTPTGEVHDQIMLDGTYFNGWCVLIAFTGRHVINWQYTDAEKRASWTALLEHIPAPKAAIVDGNGPLQTIVKKLWPTTRIQRCFFHIRQRGNTHLTRNPTLPANKELLALYKALMDVRALDKAAAWTAAFASWEAKWQSFLKHRTYAEKSTIRPAHVSPNQQWWYTHIRTRRAWKLLANLIRDDELFTWLKLAEDGVIISRTTNPLEGGPNKAIKDLLRAHRGLSAPHAVTAITWLLYHRTEHPKDAWQFVKPADWAEPNKRRIPPRTDTGRSETNALYGTSFSVEDGTGIRKGWGGRSG
ncbi:MULE transposase domain-containing protein [Brevibacterium sp. 239c]|uniref:IS1249 family transposase n=1 Tax=Brevibacterium sp. 239c TaxID=1965356 RepID=UPI000C50DF26|nr:IS1249 family transposase [Brevibacterium sp. 239c]SMX77890.1 MULE transposase domain-containing protein [Brevibacterium sp. 239c]